MNFFMDNIIWPKENIICSSTKYDHWSQCFVDSKVVSGYLKKYFLDQIIIRRRFWKQWFCVIANWNNINYYITLVEQI